VGWPAAEDERTGDAGIVGVITGFGSICIDGNEVGLDGSVPMRIDGNTAPVRRCARARWR